MAVLDVLDLPQLYQKPTAKALLDTLALLTSTPPSWEYSKPNKPFDGTNVIDTSLEPVRADAVQVQPAGVTRYLTGIVSNSLAWIQDEETREEIWHQASLRLSERSGRTAMGAITRKFRIPTMVGFFELNIHEPALTGDDLGLKTWAASYLLAKRLHTLDIINLAEQRIPQVLELGSGTGVVGMAMAGLGADVVLTDLPSIHSNLSYNARINSEIARLNGGSIRTGILDWTNPTVCELISDSPDGGKSERERAKTKFPLILAADTFYSPEHPRLLADAVKVWLSGDEDAKVIVEVPYRNASTSEIKDFCSRMGRMGLHILDEGEEKGFDDWGTSESGGERREEELVTCWWACWGRRCPKHGVTAS